MGVFAEDVQVLDITSTESELLDIEEPHSIYRTGFVLLMDSLYFDIPMDKMRGLRNRRHGDASSEIHLAARQRI